MIKAIFFLIFNILMIIPRIVIVITVALVTAVGMLAISLKADKDRYDA